MSKWRTTIEPREKLSAEAMEAFGAEAKVGLLATVNPAGEPHITLITSIMAKSASRLMWGQFSEGASKKNVLQNQRTGFCVLTEDRRLWRGKALWSHSEKQGEDYQRYNELPMFRYNAYFGIHTVHHMNLEVQYGKENLPLGKIALDVVSTLAGARAAGRQRPPAVFNAWTSSFLNNPATLKFLAWVDVDGFPKIVPVLGLKTADSGRLAFSPKAFNEELKQIPIGARIAVFGLSFKMEAVLLRGDFWGINRFLGLPLGVVDIDWVYNSMPPVPGQIYPQTKLAPVSRF